MGSHLSSAGRDGDQVHGEFPLKEEFLPQGNSEALAGLAHPQSLVFSILNQAMVFAASLKNEEL